MCILAYSNACFLSIITELNGLFFCFFGEDLFVIKYFRSDVKPKELVNRAATQSNRYERFIFFFD